MHSYFFTGLSRERRRRLTRAGIQCHELAVGRSDGIVIAETDLQRALEAMAVELETTTPTAYQGILRVSLHNRRAPRARQARGRGARRATTTRRTAAAPRQASVTIHGITGAHRRRIRQTIAEVLRPSVDGPIVLTSESEMFRWPVAGTIFNIWVDSAPWDSCRFTEIRETMWGASVNAQERDMYEPSGMGRAITTPEGDAVAELVGNNLYILWDVFAEEQWEAVFRAMLQATAQLLADQTTPHDAPQHDLDITIDRINGGRFARHAVQVLLPAVQCDISIVDREGGEQEPVEDNRFHVWLWSSPAETRGTPPTPSLLWGLEHDDDYEMFGPSGRGRIIRSPEGSAVAELVGGNNLYVLCDLCSGGECEDQIFRKILEATVALMAQPVATPLPPAAERIDLGQLRVFCRDAWRAAIEELLLPALPAKVFVSPRGGQVHHLAEDGHFHIHVWSVQEQVGVNDTPAFMWGVATAIGGDRSYASTQRGQQIVTPEGNSVAELLNNNNLYIFHHADHSGSSEEAAILRHILAATVALLPGRDGSRTTPQMIVTTSHEWQGLQQGVFRSVAGEILLPVVGKNIHIDVPHGNPLEPVDDGQFHIHLWSSPSGSRICSPPEQMFGQMVNCRHTAFAPSGMGVEIADEQGWPVAELVGEHLYIHHDICHEGTPREIKIFRKTLEATVRELTMTPEERATLPPPPRIKAEQYSWTSGCSYESYVRVLEEVLAPATELPIVVQCAQKNIRPPKDDGRYYIWIHSAPCDHGLGTAPAKLWDIPVEDRINAFRPTGEGILLYDTEGNEAGELVGTNLYIFHSLVSLASEKELQIFRRIVQEAVLLLKATRRQIAQRKREYKERLLLHTRAEYIRACAQRLDGERQQTRASITSLEDEVEKSQRTLVMYIRKLEQLRRHSVFLESDGTTSDERFGLEFDKLFETEGIKNVVIKDGLIQVFTEVLYCADPRTKKRHEIGAFRIEISPEYDGGGVRWFNLTRQVDALEAKMQAPHIYNSGRACLGNAAEIFPNLIARHQYAAVITVAIRFVQEVNVEDMAGQKINRWPVAPKARAARRAKKGKEEVAA